MCDHVFIWLEDEQVYVCEKCGLTLTESELAELLNIEQKTARDLEKYLARQVVVQRRITVVVTDTLRFMTRERRAQELPTTADLRRAREDYERLRKWLKALREWRRLYVYAKFRDEQFRRREDERIRRFLDRKKKQLLRRLVRDFFLKHDVRIGNKRATEHDVDFELLYTLFYVKCVPLHEAIRQALQIRQK